MSRIILKISGEYLKDKDTYIAPKRLETIFEIIKILQNEHHQIAIVIGGGNIFRGREHKEMNKLTADAIGMMGTVINALYLHDYLDKVGISSIVSTPFDFPYLLENFTDTELKEHFNNNEIVIFGGGVGMSGYSTDSGCILASKKLEGNLIIKLTNVSGVYDKDPKIYKDAIKFDKLSFDEVIKNNYHVMDSYAFKECSKMNLKIIVMNLKDYKKITDVINNKVKLGTVIGE